jgi:sterol desaturase/sphingolipid hydroxylase (fatty acid hydroxylase superfamily)
MRRRKIREARPPARQMVLEFLFSLRSIAIFSTVGFGLFTAEQVGWLTGPALAETWGWPWFIASLILMTVAHDAYFYWTHRLIHHPRLFRRVHLRHHRSNNPSPFTAYSFDLTEAAVNVSFVPLWMFLVPTDWPVTGLFMLHQIARNTLQHSGYEIMPARRDGRPMFDWLTSVTHHDLHHAQAGWNYGLWFTWWESRSPRQRRRRRLCLKRRLRPLCSSAPRSFLRRRMRPHSRRVSLPEIGRRRD